MSELRHVRRAATVLALSATALAAAPALSAHAKDDFIPGSATAQAQTIQLAPTTAGLNYAITQGVAIAGYAGQQGRAQAQTLDLGIIGSTVASKGCDGSNPPVSRDQLPQPLVAESSGEREAKDHSYGGQLPPAAFGNEHVEATGTPSGAARTTGMTLGAPGVLTIDGGTAEATGRLVKDKAREAQATTHIGTLSLAGGVVQLHDLTWTASQRTGEGAAHDGGFTIGSATVGGVPVPGGTQTVVDAANTALAPLGLALHLPKVTKTSEGTVQVSPLVVGMKDNQVGQQTLGAALGAAQPVRQALFDAFTGMSCKTATLFLLGDIATGPLTGAGSLEVRVGGVSAASEGIAYANPFGSGFGVPPVLGGTTPPPSGTAALPPAAPAGAPTTAADSAPAVADAGGPAPAIATRALSSTCSSTTTGGCHGDAAVAVGLAGLAVVGAIAAADAVLGRRKRRALPQLRPSQSL